MHKSKHSDIELCISAMYLYFLFKIQKIYHVFSYHHIIMYISEALVQKHQRRGSKQTGKFSAMLQMYFKYFDKKVFKILF